MGWQGKVVVWEEFINIVGIQSGLAEPLEIIVTGE